MIKVKSVDSSNVAGVGYDPNSKVLVVAFRDGGSYIYREVPEAVYQSIISAQSVGKTLYTALSEGRYESTKIFLERDIVKTSDFMRTVCACIESKVASSIVMLDGKSDEDKEKALVEYFTTLSNYFKLGIPENVIIAQAKHFVEAYDYRKKLIHVDGVGPKL